MNCFEADPCRTAPEFIRAELVDECMPIRRCQSFYRLVGVPRRRLTIAAHTVYAGALSRIVGLQGMQDHVAWVGNAGCGIRGDG
jgi:hypothetical protein